MFRTGFILNSRADTVWFLALPFGAVAFALACQQWLTALAIAAVGLWVTVPHHFATWLRTYGVREDWQRWKQRLIVGPVIIGAMTLLGLTWAPLTFLLFVTLWDHQHSVMQQHGFARIYDFKAKTGAPQTGRFDLWLGLALYINLVMTSPLFTQFWVRELYRFGLPISADAVRLVHWVCWGALGLYLLVYLGHVVSSVRRGYPLNPVKYAFIAASYMLWYFVAWHTGQLLVQLIAHRIMHGVQYIVIVRSYLGRKERQAGAGFMYLPRFIRPAHVGMFAAMCLMYAVAYQFFTNQSLDVFGFGVVSFQREYAAIPRHGMAAMSSETANGLVSLAIIQSTALVHYYFDSFIWKVRDTRVQQGL